MFDRQKFPWLKSKGYIHITPRIDLRTSYIDLIRKITNPKFIASYSFFPLLHSSIKERRYRTDGTPENRKSHTKAKGDTRVKNPKVRPIHYATHMDALIFSYYGYLIYRRYEAELDKYPGLADSILAYRKIKLPTNEGNKSTIHFAHEVFEEIKHRALKEPIVVLKFDITSFFNHMDHDVLKAQWIKLLGENGRLPPDHFRVYKATTQFSYILKDEFRLKQSSLSKGKRGGFDEKRLAQIRREQGIQSYFSSNNELRQSIKKKEIRVYKFPFRNENGRIRGIPQGLPISAILANLYLLDFDIEICKKLGNYGIYRRYSDDIILLCKEGKADYLEKEIRRLIKDDYKVEISESKTERFLFRYTNSGMNSQTLQSIKIESNSVCKIGMPLTYLGFDFFGNRTAIKNANLAKFYRRMIKTTKRKCKYAIDVANQKPGTIPVLFRRQLYRLYTLESLSKTSFKSRKSSLVQNEKGEFTLKSTLLERKYKSNYLTYISRASRIIGDPGIKMQIRSHKRILRQAINKHLTKGLPR
jgi:hypothetical protein